MLISRIKLFFILVVISMMFFACGGGGGAGVDTSTPLPPITGDTPNKIIISASDTLATVNQGVPLLIKALSSGIVKANVDNKSLSVNITLNSTDAFVQFSTNGIDYTQGPITVRTNSNGLSNVWVLSTQPGFITVKATLPTGGFAYKTIKYVNTNITRWTNLDPIIVRVKMDNNNNGTYDEANDFKVCENSNQVNVRAKVSLSVGTSKLTNKKITVRSETPDAFVFPNTGDLIDKDTYNIYTDGNGEAELVVPANCVVQGANMSVNLYFETEDIRLEQFNGNFKGIYRQTVFFAPIEVTGISLNLGSTTIPSTKIVPIDITVATNSDVLIPNGIAVKLSASCGALSETDVVTNANKTATVLYTAPNVTANMTCTITAISNGKVASQQVTIVPKLNALQTSISLAQKPTAQVVNIPVIGGVPPVTITISNPGITAVLSNGVLTVTVPANFSGSGIITLRDASGEVVNINVSVSEQALTVTPSTTTLTVSSSAQTATFNIKGGKAPYTANINPPVAGVVANITGSVLTVNIPANTTGSITVYITDADGNSTTATINMSTTSISALQITPISNITLSASASVRTINLTISGGLSPYTQMIMPPQGTGGLSANITGSTLVITIPAGWAGNANIYVSDSKSPPDTATVTVAVTP